MPGSAPGTKERAARKLLALVALILAGQACLDQLSPDERLVLEILLDPGGGKLVKISQELDVSLTTAYRKKWGVLHRISQLFRDSGVEIPWNEMKPLL